MIFESKTIQLKNGKDCILRSPVEGDAAPMCTYLKICASETEFILRSPEECNDTPEGELRFLDNINQSPNGVMLVAEVDGEIAGNCQLQFSNHVKTRHRARVAIGLVSKYWNLGIGSAMFQEMIALAKKREGIMQMELEFVEGNERARHLYEKMGFRIVAVMPDAFCMKDGSLKNEYCMLRKI